jgi:hypothetical protein
MARERRNPPPSPSRRERGVSAGERVRRRLAAEPELELTDEELRALADEGLDPEDVRRAARQTPEQFEVSPHDRDTVRDHIEGMMLEDDDS